MTSMRSGNVQAGPPSTTPNGPQQEAKENGSTTITFTMDAKEGEEMKKKIVEYSPQRRYVRFNEIIGKGAYKMVYRAYDTKEGLLVAWNTITLSGLPKHEKVRIMHEVRLLEQLDNGNIISFFGSWVNREKEEVVFITEILSSGSLKDFIRKVQVIRWKIIKRWCRQILKGLEYLHGHEPPIIHRDLKCDNIFINGSSGDLRIGDLGLSTYITGRTAPLSVLGTPEFMAPELYDEQYDVKVDIYAFGMCVLEMVSKETPYSECANAAQIYKRVTSQVPPQVLFRVRNEKAREFILACLQQDPNARPSVSELLQHPFLLNKEEEDEEVVLEPPGKGSGVPDRQQPPQQQQGHEGISPPRVGDKSEKPQGSSLRPPDVSTGHQTDGMVSGASPSVASSTAPRRGSSPAPPVNPHDADHQQLERRGSHPEKSQKETPRNAGGERKVPSSSGHPTSAMTNRISSTSSDLDHSQHDDHHHHVHHHHPPAPPASQHPRRPALSNAGDTEGGGHSRRPSGGVPKAGSMPNYEPGEALQAVNFSRNNSDPGDQASAVDMHHGYQSPAEAAHHPSPKLKVIPPPASGTMTMTPATPSPMAAPTTVQVRSSGQQGGKNVLCLVIRAKIQGKLRDIEFDFHLHDDDAYTVAQEMVTEIGLPCSDLKDIAETIIKLAASARGARRSFVGPCIPIPPTVDVSRSSSNSIEGAAMAGYNAKAMGLLEPPLLRSYSTSHLPVNNMIHMNSHHNSTATATSQQQPLDKALASLPHDSHHSQSMVMIPSGANDHTLPSALGSGAGHHHRTRTTGHIDMSSVNGHGPPPMHGGVGGGGASAPTTSSGIPWDHSDEARTSPLASANDEEETGMSKYSLPKEEELSPDDVEDAAYMKLRSEYEKNLNRVVKVHSLRMDNLRKAKEEKEECYRKQMERHSKDMADFEKKVRTAEKEQIKRLKQLEEDWRQTRADYRGKRRPGVPPPRLEVQEQAL